MTYRFGRTGRKRHAAMVSGMPAYVSGPDAPQVPVDCVYDKQQKKIVCTDTGDPLAFPQQKTSKPKRAGKKRRYGKTRRMKKRRLSSKTVTRGKCDNLYDGSKPFGGSDYQDCIIKSTR